MIEILVTTLASAGVGLAIGWTGVAGFLLPVLFIDYNGMSGNESMFLAFLCFLVGGIIGSLRYRREGLLDAGSLLPLAISSLLGALSGAMINSLFRESTVKIVLYAVVLVSGISILIRPIFDKRGNREERNLSCLQLVVTGFPAALICALTGAGGPVLLMPLLILQGMNSKKAVATALFDSIFIAIPSVAVYGMGTADMRYGIIIPVLIFHALGVFAASSTQEVIKGSVLKNGIAVFSIIFASIMLLGGNS